MPPRRTPAGLSMTAPGEDKSTFTSLPSAEMRRRLSSGAGTRPDVLSFTYLSPMWAGLAATVLPEGAGTEIGISIHDGTYSTDFAQTTLRFQNADKAAINAAIEKHIVSTLKNFSTQHLCKFLGAGVATLLLEQAPSLCTTLWRDLDIVPVVFNIQPVAKDYTAYRGKRNLLSPHADQYLSIPPSDVEDNDSDPENAAPAKDAGIPRTLDEQSDSAARKCVMFFGPNNNPRLVIGHRNRVEVDAGGKIHLIDDLETYRATVGEATWTAVNKFADELRGKNAKIGFFSSTPQGGGVALMRHALIRFFRLLDVNVQWYVPNPSPAVFRTTKDNHNILQGVADKSLRLTDSKKKTFDEWIQKNATRYWFAPGGPLAEGGVDVAFVDDPQMPGMIPLIKKFRPNLPIIYRSHIEIRSDLAHAVGSPQNEVWQYLWDNIKLADLFISHPITTFVPDDVPSDIVGLMPACTDWLDGLNKPLSHWDTQYYMGVFRGLCAKDKMAELAWPARPYVCQVARFDPAKGIPHLIASYVKFRQILDSQPKGKFGLEDTPQLLICGHGAVDDPDATIIYDQVMGILQNTEAKNYVQDICVMRLPPSDQLLNALMSNARIALQLSSREGFEVKVSEAIHDGRPMIATRAGGIPLQVQHGKNGFLVEINDAEAVARHLFQLWTDDALYDKMSDFAKTSVSDEVSTVGNAACWLYLAAVFTRDGPKLKPNGEWINELLRKEAGVPYQEGENRLPRLGFRNKQHQ
ncbi:trehalose phosphorylase [Auriculariales sp. MPI-PUGE-AT-0066]|nr:trehalose phosphorylase [Auriculariales sp. MPI-PUGE-AT-0066]